MKTRNNLPPSNLFGLLNDAGREKLRYLPKESDDLVNGDCLVSVALSVCLLLPGLAGLVMLGVSIARLEERPFWANIAP